MKLEIIMFNMSSYSEWQRGVANRNRHIFYKLLKRPEVERIIAIDFLPFTFKRALRNYWQNIIKGLKGKVIYRDLTTRCIKISNPDSAELYILSTIDSVFSHKKAIEKINKVLRKISQLTNYPSTQLTKIIWSYFPMFVDYFKGIKADLTIFDAVDNWIEHPSFFKYKELLKKNYQIIAEKSNLIFVVSDNLIEFFRSLGRGTDLAWVSNGVDVAHFTRPLRSDLPKKSVFLRDFKKIPRPIIGYLGIIQQRLDLGLLEYLAERNPDKSFVLVGPLWPVYFRKLRRSAIEIKRLKKYKNIYLLGWKPYHLAPAYIKNFDLAISPHKLDKFIRSTNSLKALEYLACGKPVVTTPASGVERLSHLVYIAQDYQDFNKKINQALESNLPELKEKRISQMKQEDWSLKVEEMMKLIRIKNTKLL